jgi:hypothetical protein
MMYPLINVLLVRGSLCTYSTNKAMVRQGQFLGLEYEVYVRITGGLE